MQACDKTRADVIKKEECDMSRGIQLLLGGAMACGIAMATSACGKKQAEVTVPEEGPAQVEEQVPSKPEEKAAFDQRKAASACRVAILQSLRDPSSAEFVDGLEATTGTVEESGDYRFKIGVKAKSDAGVVTRHFDCKAHPETSGWSIAELKEGA